MRRRDVLAAGAASFVATLDGTRVMAQGEGPEDWARRAAEMRAEARAAFPYEVIEAPGREALDTWERLKGQGRGAPVVVGGGEDFDRIVETFHPSYWPNEPPPTVDETLKKAAALSHPESLTQLRRAEEEALERYFDANPELRAQRDAFIQQMQDQGVSIDADSDVPLGEWPDEPPSAGTLSVVWDYATQDVFQTVNIVLVPTDDWTTIPAHLRWGGWNENPPAEHHVAALRSWRDRYGAELIGMSGDVLNLRVARRATTREEALTLGREHHLYCNDIIDQGYGTLSNLAAALMGNDWWYFWWD